MVKTVKKHISSIGIVIKRNHPEAAQLAEEIADFLIVRGRKVFFEDCDSKPCKQVRCLNKQELISKCDLLIILGGDGTYIGIARLMKKRSVPVLGINMGQLGFLTEIKKEEAFDVLNRILKRNELTVSERALLNVRVMRGKKAIFEGPVVNDVVLSKGSISRIIGIQVAANGRFMTIVRADGIIVSTPTGSTAYNLAAGGPILEPSVPAFVIAPICAHSLTNRPIIVPDNMEISLKLHERSDDTLLTLDGQQAIDIDGDDVIEINLFKKHRLQLISSPTRDYFDLLREKFSFGVRA